MSTYWRLVQSACCHPDWDAEDHAMYLWSEHLFRDGGKDDPEFITLVHWCGLWLDDHKFHLDVASALDFAG